MAKHRQVIPATPEDSLWLEILLRDQKLAAMSDEAVRKELVKREFPLRLVATYLEMRTGNLRQDDGRVGKGGRTSKRAEKHRRTASG